MESHAECACIFTGYIGPYRLTQSFSTKNENDITLLSLFKQIASDCIHASNYLLTKVLIRATCFLYIKTESCDIIF